VVSFIQGHSEVAHYLLEHGADPHLRAEFDSITPLQAARKHGRTEFVKLLRHRGAKDERQPFWWRWLPI